MKTKIVLSAVVVAGIGIFLVLKHPSRTKLRDQPKALPQQVEPLARLDDEGQLDPGIDKANDPAAIEFENETQKRNNNLKVWGLDFHIYARKHNDRFPESWEQALSMSQHRSLLKDPAKLAAYMNFLTNNFEIVYRGTADGITKPGETVLFREKQARRSPQGEWVKVYGFADGSTRIHTEPNEVNFDAWEQQRIVESR
jgi:hypothetical protein